jgi:hypothetical protein
VIFSAPNAVGMLDKSLLVGYFAMRAGRSYPPRTLVSNFIRLSTIAIRFRMPRLGALCGANTCPAGGAIPNSCGTAFTITPGPYGSDEICQTWR